MRAHRIDAAAPARSAPVRTPQGGLRVPANLTRVGVFEYSDGTKTWREYKPAESASDPAFLASMRDAPVTVDHPPVLVTADNWGEYAVGHVGEPASVAAPFVVGDVTVQQAGAVAQVEAGALCEVSLGYECDVDWTPGSTPEGEPYDAIQRNLRVNHVALGPEGWGRAGPDVRLRMNGAAVMVQGADTSVGAVAAARQENDMKKKIKIGAREVHLDAAEDEAAAQGAVDDMKKNGDAALEKLAAAESALQAAMAQIAELKAAMGAPPTVTEEMVPEAVMNAALAKRATLHADARAVLGADAKLDDKAPAEIKRAVIEHALPGTKLDALDAKVVEGMFAATVAGARKAAEKAAAAPARNDALAALHQAAAQPATGADDEDPAARMARAREQQRLDSMKGGR